MGEVRKGEREGKFFFFFLFFFYVPEVLVGGVPLRGFYFVASYSMRRKSEWDCGPGHWVLLLAYFVWSITFFCNMYDFATTSSHKSSFFPRHGSFYDDTSCGASGESLSVLKESATDCRASWEHRA